MTIWQLTVIEGPDEGRRFSVAETEPLVIGRGNDSDTKIRDPRLSRVHCEIQHRNGDFVLIDRGGSGGVILDGSPTSESPLKPGAQFRIGDTTLRFDHAHTMEASTVAPLGASPSQTTDDESDRSDADSLLGQKLHNYEVQKLINVGRNSMIFKGWDAKHERIVAIKVLKPQFAADDTQRERFIRSIKTMLPVKHPNIIRIYQAGIRGPHCWTAMQWIEGDSVLDMIERIGISGMLDWREAWNVGVDIANALVAAKEAGIVHRNITPSNILQRADDKVYLLSDLILAKALEFTSAAQLTQPGDFVGELSYLAPERILAPHQVDERCDQFALGATLYALLTGHAPYQALSVGDYLEKLKSPPTDPADAQMSTDQRFAGHVMRMIDPAPERRFNSAEQVLEAMQEAGKWSGLSR